MLRDTYVLRFLQAGGQLSDLQEQLGLADPISIGRYQRYHDKQKREEPASSGQAKPPQPARRSKSKRRKARER